MEISRLHRTVTIVARGTIAPDEIRGMAQKLAEAQVRSFAKIIEVAGARTEMSQEQVLALAAFLRRPSEEKRGPVAFVVDPNRKIFPQDFADATASEGPIALFTSLREARDWVTGTGLAREREHAEANKAAGAAVRASQTASSDPDRRGVLFRGERQREVTVRSLNAA